MDILNKMHNEKFSHGFAASVQTRRTCPYITGYLVSNTTTNTQKGPRTRYMVRVKNDWDAAKKKHDETKPDDRHYAIRYDEGYYIEFTHCKRATAVERFPPDVAAKHRVYDGKLIGCSAFNDPNRMKVGIGDSVMIINLRISVKKPEQDDPALQTAIDATDITYVNCDGCCLNRQDEEHNKLTEDEKLARVLGGPKVYTKEDVDDLMVSGAGTRGALMPSLYNFEMKTTVDDEERMARTTIVTVVARYSNDHQKHVTPGYCQETMEEMGVEEVVTKPDEVHKILTIKRKHNPNNSQAQEEYTRPHLPIMFNIKQTRVVDVENEEIEEREANCMFDCWYNADGTGLEKFGITNPNTFSMIWQYYFVPFRAILTPSLKATGEEVSEIVHYHIQDISFRLKDFVLRHGHAISCDYAIKITKELDESWTSMWDDDNAKTRAYAENKMNQHIRTSILNMTELPVDNGDKIAGFWTLAKLAQFQKAWSFYVVIGLSEAKRRSYFEEKNTPLDAVIDSLQMSDNFNKYVTFAIRNSPKTGEPRQSAQSKAATAKTAGESKGSKKRKRDTAHGQKPRAKRAKR